MIEMLLTANPEAAKYRDSNGNNMLHHACQKSPPSELCIGIMKLVLACHKDAVQGVATGGRLPTHDAAACCDVEVLEFLLGLYPEAANAVTSKGCSLLYTAASTYFCPGVVSKVQHLCSRYPTMIQQRSNDGELPIHRVACSRKYKTMLALYEAGGIEQFKTPVAHPTKATYKLNGYLPLHLFIANVPWYCNLRLPENGNAFRWLLQLYPEAAGIEGGVGANKGMPYQLAVDAGLPDFCLRLLLRAAPTLNPPELHRLNYAERRMAMFLAFKALSSSMEVPLLVRLRGESKDLVQRVVSFL
jgi:hypothetical protein